MRKLKKLFAFICAVMMVGSFASCDLLNSVLGNGGSSSTGSSSSSSHVHNLSYVARKSAEYAVHGNLGHFKCDDCGKLFSDANGKNEVAVNQVRLSSETGFDKQVYTVDDYSLNYCLYEPTDLDKEEDSRPLILFLHGAGERGSNNEWQLKNAILEVVGEGEWAKSVIIAPQCPSSTGGNTNSSVSDPNKWVETPWTNGNYVQANVPESKPLHAAAALVEEYSQKDYIDSSRVYVVGLSMGGFGTWDILSRYPDLFAAGVPICGGGPTDKIDVLKDIPIYTFHGSSDGSVPYAGTKAMYEAIQAAGGNKIIFKTFTGAGHGIWNDAITYQGFGTVDDPSLENWLFAQYKN